MSTFDLARALNAHAGQYPEYFPTSRGLDHHQKLAHNEAIQALSTNHRWVSIAAGAGSGKTKTLTAIARTLVAAGMSPTDLALLSFTKAASRDLQRKTIHAFLSNGETLVAQPSGATIHAFAASLIKLMHPHIMGLSLYAENATQTANSNDETQDDRNLQLSLLVSLYYGDPHAQSALHQALCDEIPRTHSSLSGIISDLNRWGELSERARTVIEDERGMHAGLGSFTDMSSADPDRLLAVCTEALLRWHQDHAQPNGPDGELPAVIPHLLPQVILYDEAQDGDVLHLLFLRALMINGVRVIAVGDAHQELYAFRHAIGDLPFKQTFIQALTNSAGHSGKVSEHALLSNYRSRASIVNLGNDLSDALQKASVVRQQQIPSEDETAHRDSIVVNPVRKASAPRIDPITHRPFGENANTIRVFQGAALLKSTLENLRPITPTVVVPTTVGGSLAAANFLAKNKASNVVKKDDKERATRATKGQLVVIAGNEDGSSLSSEFERTVFDLFDRACRGESVALLATQNFSDHDRRLLRDVLLKKWLTTNQGMSYGKGAQNLEFHLLGKRKTPALGAITTLTRNLDRATGVPFSSLMAFAALAWFVGLGKSAHEARDIQGLVGKHRGDFIPGASGQAAGEYVERNRDSLMASVSAELSVLFGFLATNDVQIFEGVDQGMFKSVAPTLINACAEYILQILIEFAVIAGPKPGGGTWPCRLHYLVRYSETVDKKINIPLEQIATGLRRFWKALVKAPFFSNGNIVTSVALAAEKAGFVSEYLPPRVSLGSLSKEVLGKMDAQAALHRRGQTMGMSLAALEAQQEIQIDREFVHEAFVARYKKMCSEYVQALAGMRSEIQKAGTEMDAKKLWSVYGRDEWIVRMKTGLTFDENISRGSVGGIVKVFTQVIREVVIEDTGGQGIGQTSMERPIIDLATVHASKGLEWDHVMFCVPTSPKGPTVHEESMTSVRNLWYVAVTRARRTLVVGLPKIALGIADIFVEKGRTFGAVKSSLLVLANFLRAPERQCWWASSLDWEIPGETNDVRDEQLLVFQETSHTEVEVASRCAHEYDQRFRRGLTPLSLITTSNYSFVFHSTLASICAQWSNQRLGLPYEDPVRKVTASLKEAMKDPGLTEKVLATYLRHHHLSDMQALMEVMKPLYLTGEDQDGFNVLRLFYAEAFLQHLAAVVCGSQLFKWLQAANTYDATGQKRGEVWIEKPQRFIDRVPQSNSSKEHFFPIYGIPDVRIRVGDVLYIADYKTMPVPEPKKGGETPFLQVLSETAMGQVNLYQHIGGLMPGVERRISELILVSNVTVPDHKAVPTVVPVLPDVLQGKHGFKFYSTTEHARVATSEQPSRGLDQAMQTSIVSLRERLDSRTRSFVAVPNNDGYTTGPLIGDTTCSTDEATCAVCSLAIHCSKMNQPQHLEM